MSFVVAAMLASAAMAQDITIERDGLDGPLAGTLEGTTDTGQPGVVIIPGSGPTDRDGNNPGGVLAGSYRYLAQGLAEAGIASIRMDKRGMFESASAIADGNDVTIEDYAGDALAWVAAMRERTGGDCAWLAGHSEGGIVALRAAVEAPEGLCGVVLIAAPGRPVGTILREQLAANPANAIILEEAERHIASLEAGEAVTEPVHPGLAPLFAPQLQTFLLSLFAQDPAALIARIDLPVLILQGREDLQVTEADAQVLAAANPAARLLLLEGVNHVLKSVPEGDRGANLAAYADPNLPLAEGVMSAIVEFVTNADR